MPLVSHHNTVLAAKKFLQIIDSFWQVAENVIFRNPLVLATVRNVGHPLLRLLNQDIVLFPCRLFPEQKLL